MKITDILLIILNFAGGLAVFLFAMKLMSEGLQKVAGQRMRALLGKLTGNRLSGILTGAGVTATIQSSSATTVMVVSFVNAGMLSLSGAVAVIMGANIGTTMTAWIISLLGLGEGGGQFSLALLLAALSLPFTFSKKERLQAVGQPVMGLALLLVGMDLLKGAMPDLGQYPQLLEGIASLSGWGMGSVLLFVAIGTALTCVMQSSSAMMAITLLMCHQGLIEIDMAIALVMGENIGTTITANMAAMVANASAKKAARAHLVFNVVGVTVSLLLFYPITRLIQGVFPANAPMAVSLFHTMFNVGNTLLQVWFIPQILWIVDHLVKEEPAAEGGKEYSLTYISRGPIGTAELNLQSAKKEIELFGQRVAEMYAKLPGLRDEKEFDTTMQQIEQGEQLTDRMEMELTGYLTAVAGGNLSGHTTERVSAMLRVVDNLESIGDCILQIALTRKNKRADAVHFSDHLNDNLAEMSALVEGALEVMESNLHDYNHADLTAATEAEERVNACRDRLRSEHLEALRTQRYGYAIGNAYSTLYAQYEKLADHIINVSEALCGGKWGEGN